MSLRPNHLLSKAIAKLIQIVTAISVWDNKHTVPCAFMEMIVTTAALLQVGKTIPETTQIQQPIRKAIEHRLQLLAKP